MYNLAIIIPCYNEAKRLNKQAFTEFANYHHNIILIFINDGSKDATNQVLDDIKIGMKNVVVIELSENKGKGNAVREGLLYAIKSKIPFIAYLDADLSTPLIEIVRLFKLLIEENASIIFGSRIKKLDTNIKRSLFRHFTGRVIATIINNRFDLNCYDTQCGAKVFEAGVLEKLIDQPFFTRWFFDVEILCRTKKNYTNLNVIEAPLKKWTNIKNSKISLLTSGLILKELFILHKNY